MRKTRFIALVLVAAMMLAGAGYAAWNDTLKVETTVTTGELDVAFEDTYGFGQDVGDFPHIYILKSGKWIDAGQDPYNPITSDYEFDDEDADILTFTFENMFPGTMAVGKYRMRNVGTIPVVAGDVNVTIETINDGDDDVADIEAAMKVTNSDIRILNPDNTVKYQQKLNLASVTELESALKTFLADKVLEPGDSLALGDGEQFENLFRFEIPTTLNGDAGENETVKVTIDFDFIQHNMVPAPTPVPGV